MSNYVDVLNSIKESIEFKKQEIEACENRLLLLDITIDKFDTLIINIDTALLPLLDEINSAALQVQQAYNNRISSGCRSDLAWVLVDEWSSFSGESFATYYQYEVKKNKDTKSSVKLSGAKYYQYPSDRDYGANIVDTFLGNASRNIPLIEVIDENGIPNTIRIGDTITDNVDSPAIFSISDLPTVVGFGTTTIVGIVTTLVGGISTGSAYFAHYGAGNTTGLQVGYSFERVGVVTALITGFGSTNFPVTYYDPSGVFVTETISVPAIILSSAAYKGASDVSFNVGASSTLPAIFVSESPVGFGTSITFTALRKDGEIQSIDPTKSPFSPLKIGVINSSTLGAGHSVSYDTSGNPSATETWNQDKSYYDPVKEKIIKPEPEVGAGEYVYNTGTFQWPTITTYTETSPGSGIYNTTVSYATEGTTITVGGINSPSITYSSTSPLNPGNCSQLNSAISENTSNFNSIKSANEPEAQRLIAASRVLRKQRAEKQLYAWSLLQAISDGRQKLQQLEEDLREMEGLDLSQFDS